MKFCHRKPDTLFMFKLCKLENEYLAILLWVLGILFICVLWCIGCVRENNIEYCIKHSS